MSSIWENSEHGGTTLLLLLAIADHANDDGIAWPSIPRLAEKIRMSERYTRQEIQKLVESGELEIVELGGGRRSTTYRIITSDCHKKKRRGEAGLRGEAGFPPELDLQAEGRQGSGQEGGGPPPNHNINDIEYSPPPAAQPRTAEQLKQQTIEAMARGLNRDLTIKEQIEKTFAISPNWDTKTARAFTQWLKGRPPSQTIDQFASWWRTKDWRGREGQPPSLMQIRELWPQAFTRPVREEEYFVETHR